MHGFFWTGETQNRRKFLTVLSGDETQLRRIVIDKSSCDFRAVRSQAAHHVTAYKIPCTALIPTGKRLVFFSISAFAAPASSTTNPWALSWSASHFARACHGACTAVSCVPIASPCARRGRTFSSRPHAITVLDPLRAARLAARILVIMPPLRASLRRLLPFF